MELNFGRFQMGTKILSVVLFYVLLYGGAHASQTLLEKTASEITRESLLPNMGESGRPLPLAAHWNAGVFETGYTPVYQLELIKKGHHVLPWFQLPSPISKGPPEEYYKRPLQELSKLKLPISFVSTQWEMLLTKDPKYFGRPEDSNPNVITLTGKIDKKVSPFGPKELWRDVGKEWTNQKLVRQMQGWYPNPPLTLFVSNNEHKKLRWYESLTSRRYLDTHGLLHGDEFMRKVVGEKWITLYRSLQSGMKVGLVNSNWRNNSKFIGYNAFGAAAFGRWGGWIKYSLQIENRIEPWPLAWDGASASFYVHNWDPSTDYNLMGPQVQGMNRIFMLKQARQLNPEFWFELSTWDGYEPKKDNDQRKYYQQQGQLYNPQRYEGMVQFGAWLMRPRVVREFRGWTDTVKDSGMYFKSVLNSVDRVYELDMLEKFWRNGELLANKKNRHPFQSNIPKEYKDENRWYLLDTSLDPPRPWKITKTNLKLFSIAFELGEKPNREWLVYVFSPIQLFENVDITVPSYGNLHLEQVPQWGFYHLSEDGMTVKPIQIRAFEAAN